MSDDTALKLGHVVAIEPHIRMQGMRIEYGKDVQIYMDASGLAGTDSYINSNDFVRIDEPGVFRIMAGGVLRDRDQWPSGIYDEPEDGEPEDDDGEPDHLREAWAHLQEAARLLWALTPWGTA